MKIISIRLFCLFILLIFSIKNQAQSNIVYNSGFEQIKGSNGTNVLQLDAALFWEQMNSADVYIKKVLGDIPHGNIARLATYFNEVMIGSLKRNLMKGERITFKFDLYSEKSKQYNNNFSLLFCEYQCDSVSSIPIPIKKIKKGWQTISVEMIVSNTTDTFCFIGSSKNIEDTFFLDNMEIIAEDVYHNDSTTDF